MSIESLQETHGNTLREALYDSGQKVTLLNEFATTGLSRFGYAFDANTEGTVLTGVFAVKKPDYDGNTYGFIVPNVLKSRTRWVTHQDTYNAQRYIAPDALLIFGQRFMWSMVAFQHQQQYIGITVTSGSVSSESVQAQQRRVAMSKFLAHVPELCIYQYNRYRESYVITSDGMESLGNREADSVN